LWKKGGVIMEITKKQFKHCDLITVTGRVDSSTAPLLGDALNEVTNEGRFHVVVDLSDLEFLSSAGIWVLVNTQKTCKRYNRGEVVLVNVPDRILSTLDLAGLVPFFTISTDLTDAVGSF
jgi:anti-sigma B factor antagonist